MGADSYSDDTSIEIELHHDERPSNAIIRCVAAITDTPPLELPPLENTVPSELLDRLLASKNTDSLVLEFEYACTRVEIEADGTLRVHYLEAE